MRMACLWPWSWSMIVIMLVIVVIMIVVMVVIVAFQELRLDIEDAVEVEGVAAEHLGQRNLRALGLVQLGIRVDAADARLDLAQLVGVTRSVLLMRITSAKAIWFLASGASLSRS